MSTTDFNRIRRLGGPNETFPGKTVYLFGSVARMDASAEWMRQFHKEAANHNMTVETSTGHVYLTWS